MDILQKIIEQKKIEVSNSLSKISIEELENSHFFSRKTFSLKETLKTKSGIIAEFKRKSPSKGIINDAKTPLEVITDYQKYGASAVSILTDDPFFGGNKEDIFLVRESINIPILRKDFMIDEYQFYEAKNWGADLVLLIAACLSPSQVKEFTDLAHQLKLEVLLEIHNEEELKHIHNEVDFVGINNRNLKDFKVDLQHSIALKNKIPHNIPIIAESGIYSKENFIYLKEKGFDGFLMGEYFMKTENPGTTLQKLTSSR